MRVALPAIAVLFGQGGEKMPEEHLMACTVGLESHLHTSLQVEQAFPDKEDARIIVACSNGRAYSMDALEALDEAGYTNLVGLRGGYYAWNRWGAPSIR